jgi:manganese transport protein
LPGRIGSVNHPDSLNHLYRSSIKLHLPIWAISLELAMSELVRALRNGATLDLRVASLSERTVASARDILAGRNHGLRRTLAFAGPAVVASIAYMDPGNFATNIEAGAKYGYDLLWVVLLANVVAMLFQSLSAKLGIVTGRNLAELCREQFPQRLVWAMWMVSEVAAMATDLAEFLGGAIGLSLLFHIQLLAGMIITAVAVYAMLGLERYGFRQLELIIGGLVAVIGLSYLAELFIAPVDWSAVAVHSVLPRIADRQALLLAVGIIGATVMPHAIYLHSGLTQARIPARTETERSKIVRASNREVLIALAIAGLVNMAMVAMASGAFHAGHREVAAISVAYHTLTPVLGTAAAIIFLVSLLASGVSSSVVGTMAGQVIMQGFVGFTIPIWLRRTVTMLPAFAVVGLGVDATNALVISQVVLSAALPLPMIALVMFTRRSQIMGRFANRGLTHAAAIGGTVLVLALNTLLVLQTIGVALPGLSA